MLKRIIIACSLSLLCTSPASAHTGVGATVGFVAGFSHPLHGIDHLLVMLAVGVWAGSLGGQAVWAVPAGFVSLMALGAFAQSAHLGLPLSESVVALSVLVLGVAVWRQWQLSAGLAAALVGLFAFFHGYIHAVEMGATPSVGGYVGGVMLATAGLHGLGILACLKVQSLCRFFGLLCAVTGVCLLASV